MDCSRKRSAISPTERPPTALMPAIDRRSVTKRVRGFRIGAGERREHALIIRLAVAGRERQAFEVLRERGLAVEVLDQPPLPGRRQIERGDQRGEQPDIAGHDRGALAAEMRGGLESERQRFGVGGGLVGSPERLDPGLQEFTRQSPRSRKTGPR